MRFGIRIDGIWQPFLWLIGATHTTSFVELTDTELRVRMGAFRYVVPRRQVVGARRLAASWTYGVGIHTNVVSTIIVNGSLHGVVELHIEPAVRLFVLVIPVTCRRLLVSLEEPDAFLAALGAPEFAGG